MKDCSAERVRNLSVYELTVECAASLDIRAPWEEFHRRLKSKIVTYFWCAYRKYSGDALTFNELIEDWIQDFYRKLLQHEGRVIKSFRGKSDDSVYAFLASIATTIVSDHVRAGVTARRNGKHVPLEVLDQGSHRQLSPTVDTILDWIDAERILAASGEPEKRDRDLLIFKLHYIDGLTASELAAMPVFNLSVSGMEKLLGRLRARLARLKRIDKERTSVK